MTEYAAAAKRSGLPTAMLAKLESWATANPEVVEPALIVLTHGISAATATLAPDNLRGPLGECYDNSQSAARALRDSGGSARYCEGYAYHPKYKIAFPHGWLLTEDGKVLETTWTDTTDITYLGVPFSPEELDGLTQLAAGPLLFGDWERDFVLTERHNPCCRVR